MPLQRRGLALGLTAAAALGGLAWRRSESAPVFSPQATPHAFSLVLDTRQRLGALNRRVLGSNVQWTDGGDNLLGPDDRFDPALLARVQALGPTVLRFPGGAQSDLYHWQRGMGPQAQRGENEHAHLKKGQRSRFGTREFLELCEATGAEPLITANLASGSAEEAAAWLRATNVQRLVSSRSGQPLPKVGRWELGNEPYLTEERPELALKPEAFAARVDAFALALRAVDPAVQLGVPLSLDRRNGIPVSHQPGFMAQVLSRLNQPMDFAAIHNAYMPFGMDRRYDAEQLYWGAMAGARAVQADLDTTVRQLAALRPGRPPLPLAITEFHALFTLGRGATDDWVCSPAAALYLADVLRLFATRPELLLATQWSLSGNWRFGLFHQQGWPRPAALATQLMGELIRGERLGTELGVGTVATPGVGLAMAQPALPLIETLASREGATSRVLLIHKDPRRPAQGSVRLAAGDRLRSASLSLLRCDDVLDASDQPERMRRSVQALDVAGPLSLTLPPHSLALLTLEHAA